MATAEGKQLLSDKNDNKVLMVGLVCFDIINILETYPLEDTDTRATDQLWNRGGNAANSSVVLSQLGAATEFIGTLARHTLSSLMLEDLHHYGVRTEHCVHHADCQPPVSCVLSNSTTGTRTIIHGNRSLPELSAEDLKVLDLNMYAWIHFEGRNTQEVNRMIDRIDNFNRGLDEETSDKRIRISFELEKPKIMGSTVTEILPKVDVIFVSKDYAKACGCDSGEECVAKIYKSAKNSAQVVCAWGELGAWAIGPHQAGVVHSPAYPPETIEDSLGAGDTFIAGVIFSLRMEQNLKDAISFGCRLAGYKIGHRGFDIGTEALTDLKTKCSHP